ncbi:MAG: hypothetical protein EBR01_14200 [Proteobacteria bacterium]|nr:hypothetical protein [Pseudomonadota bacterium]
MPIISIVISSAIISNVAFAGEDAVYLEKDSKAPYAGILLPVEKATNVRKSLIELDALRAINESYVKSIQMYQNAIQLNDQKYNILSEQNDKLSVALVESRKSADLQKIIWFGFGVIATGFAVYGAKKITQ